MPRDLEPLCHPLAASDQGLESVDPRLSALTDLAERGQYAAAADRVEELFSEGIYDIRPISYYLYEAFLEGGFDALPRVFEATSVSLSENFEAIGPEKRREHHFDKRLTWLFETILSSIEYHEVKRTSEWAAWQLGLTVATLERAGYAAQELVEKIAAGPCANAGRGLGRLRDVLRARAEAMTVQAMSDHPPPVDAKKLSGLPSPYGPEAHVRGQRLRVELTASHRFTELCSKLRAFEILIEKGDHEKAALVADDLLHIVESFDPRTYFPELFASFGALFSKNIAMLSGHFDHKDSPAWKALAQFYQVDLKSFVES